MIKVKLGRSGVALVVFIIALMVLHYWLFVHNHFTAHASNFNAYLLTWPFMIIEFVLISVPAFYAFSLLRFIKPLKEFKRAAQRLGVNINAKNLYPLEGPKIVQETSQALMVMQKRIIDLLDNRTKMVSSISHDLRTYLTRLKLRTELLSSSEHTKKMQADFYAMEQLIADILWFATHDDKQLIKNRLDIRVLLVDICDDYEDVGLPVVLSIMAQKAIILGHLLSLKRVFNNVIDNALKYSQNRSVSVTVSADTQFVIVVIKDQGSGVSQEELNYMTNPRTDAKTKAKISGTGLGSAIVQEILRQHKGNISFENLNPHGLAVTITLPIALESNPV